MERKIFEWQDDDGWRGTADESTSGKIGIALHDNGDDYICHVINKKRMGGILFGIMCLASPECPKAGEFWIVEVDGVRRIVQVQDAPTDETLQGEVKFLARVPMGEGCR